MSARHTPGPWKAVSASACAEIEVMEIAEVSHMRVIPASGGWPIAGTPEDDARLIAAAPDLLEALELLTAGIESSVSDTYIPLVKARAAIAKATGGAA